VGLANNIYYQLQYRIKRLYVAESLIQEDQEYLQGFTKKKYEEELAELKTIPRTQGRQQTIFGFPTTKANIERMENMIDGFMAMSVGFRLVKSSRQY
jgi:hypothetical protein